MRVVDTSLYEPRENPATQPPGARWSSPSPGAPLCSPPPLRAEAFHCRRADNRMQTQKACKAETLDLTECA